MKSPLEKLRKFVQNKNEHRENWDHHISAHLDGLGQAAKDMKDMRTCYDSLLFAAAATANSAYEFSESLLEMGNCLVEKTAIHDDGESGGALSLLGKVQLQLQKLVDSYRSHIVVTITNPSESLLSELRKVEEMKLQCDEKREMLEYMVGQFRDKGKLRHGKGDSLTSQQLQAVSEEYDEAARLCVFRVESLKQGQCRSLLTQAARHHAAQLNFFRKGLQSLEAVEPQIKLVAEKLHIDYDLCEVNDWGDGDNEDNSLEINYEGELSFDYRKNKQEVDNVEDHVQTNIGKNEWEKNLGQQHRESSYSAPIYSDKFDPAERIREMQTSVQKLNTHVLPTPADVSNYHYHPSKALWNSSPLDTDNNKHTKSTDEETTHNNRHFLPLPRPITEEAPQFDPHSEFDTQKIKRQAFSGPLSSKPSSNKLLLSTSGPISSIEPPQLKSRLPQALNVPHNPTPPLLSSPKISELHELPRPPDSFSSKPIRSLGGFGHSAPIVNKNRQASPTSRNQSNKQGSPLPLPKLTVSRSFSIPSSSQRTTPLNTGKLLGSSQMEHKTTERAASPPLTPMALSKTKLPNSGQIRVDAGGQ